MPIPSCRDLVGGQQPATFTPTPPPVLAPTAGLRNTAFLKPPLARSVAKTRGTEWLYTRLADLSPGTFCNGEIAMCSTHGVQPPPAFQGVWHHFAVQHGACQFPADEMSSIARASVVLLFCDTGTERLMEIAQDFAACFAHLDFRPDGQPILILVPHSVAPEFRHGGDTSGLRLITLSDALAACFHDVVLGEPIGLKLALQLRNRMAQHAYNRSLRNVQINKRRNAMEQRARRLKNEIDFIVWEHLRIRLGSKLPAIDADLGLGMPVSVRDYLIGDRLGEGSFGQVYKLMDPSKMGECTGQVMKIIDKRNLTNYGGIVAFSEQIQTMEVLESFTHPNVIRFYEVFHAKDYVLIQMENGGSFDLSRHLALREKKRTCFGLHNVVSALSQAASGVCHMHSLRIAHRDIKPENMIVLETAGEIGVKIVDFDSARVLPHNVLIRGVVGTFPFMAPEMYSKDKYDAFPADIWSLAVTFLEILCGLNTLQTALGLARCGQQSSFAQRVEMQRSSTKRIYEFFAFSGNAETLLQRHIKLELSGCLAESEVLVSSMLNVSSERRSIASEVDAFFE